jgi:glycosyltransferase involved in cell wall biosynthesis
VSLSLISRAYKSSELRNLSSFININAFEPLEVIGVCNQIDKSYNNIKLFQEDSSRFKARITGINMATSDTILLIDSDQVPEIGLIEELSKLHNDIVIIPEKSLLKNLVGICLDDWRFRNEKWAIRNPHPNIPVIPRYYKRELLMKAIDLLPKEVFSLTNHEDSILYYETFKISQDVAFTRNSIYNYDPSLRELLHKAYFYGKSSKLGNDIDIPNDIRLLIRTLDKSTLNVKEHGIGIGYFIQLLRAIAFKMGEIL